MIPPEWMGEIFILEAERRKDINLMAYRHEYMGEPVGTGGEVFPNIEVRNISDDELIMRGDYIFQGLDFDFAVDPAAFVRVHYDSRKEEIFM